MHAFGPEDFRRFQESDNTTFVGVLPISAKITADLSEIAVEHLAIFTDRMTLAISFRIREGHPELAWRERGRPGHPYTAVGLRDDIGTPYLVMPGAGGGGEREYNHLFRIVPTIPPDATRVTILVAETDWEARMGYAPDGSREVPLYRWSVDVDTPAFIPVRSARSYHAEADTE